MTVHPIRIFDTPEDRSRTARRTLCAATHAMCLCAHGNGVTDDRLKMFVLSMRSQKLAILSDDEALDLVISLELSGA